MVISLETGLKLPSKPSDMAALLSRHFAVPSGQLEVFGKEDWMAPVASGSNAPAAMVVCPCSAGTLAAIAAGVSNKLIERAADVMLKEQRKLILVPREMPFSVIHLENMLRLARAGAVILPANPGFYHQPTHIADLVDFVVARILDHLNVEHNLATRWGNTEPGPDE
jgi:4-hydroxy-3-polyprenylbenzoate decarboxylase